MIIQLGESEFLRVGNYWLNTIDIMWFNTEAGCDGEEVWVQTRTRTITQEPAIILLGEDARAIRDYINLKLSYVT